MIEVVAPILASGLIGAVTALATERYRSRLDARHKYRESQASVYIDLYRSIIDLKSAADHLWELANLANLSDFITQLLVTEKEIRRNALLMDKNDLLELNAVLREFRNFRIGRERLIDLLKDESEAQLTNRGIRELLRRNREIKLRYDRLVEKTDASFRSHMKAL